MKQKQKQRTLTILVGFPVAGTQYLTLNRKGGEVSFSLRFGESSPRRAGSEAGILWQKGPVSKAAWFREAGKQSKEQSQKGKAHTSMTGSECLF